MTYLANPRHYSQDEFKALVDSLSWAKGWKPKFPTVHNTGVPTLATWQGWSHDQQERWGGNLNRYYKSMGWHSGPHIVCCPDYIWVLCELEQDGVSVSCWNHLTIGIETLGDYDKEDWNSGGGARVRDRLVWVLTVLSHKLGWEPDPLVMGVKGMHFHRMCTKDHHHCPGDNVSRTDLVERVASMKGALFAPSVALAQSGEPSTPVQAQAQAIEPVADLIIAKRRGRPPKA